MAEEAEPSPFERRHTEAFAKRYRLGRSVNSDGCESDGVDEELDALKPRFLGVSMLRGTRWDLLEDE